MNNLLVFQDLLYETSEGLNVDDIEDFCALAQHYESKTPQSFRKVRQLPLTLN